ncbi:Uncharacterised protein [Mycobacteroides abscessus]|nr:Uncharacterised protein [Mycobacteroides abscessus]
MLRVDRQLRMTVYPVLQFGAWQRRQLHVDRVARRIEHPSVPAERQAGTLDSPAEQPPAKIGVEPAQPVGVDIALVYPHHLAQRGHFRGTQTEERCLIDEVQMSDRAGCRDRVRLGLLNRCRHSDSPAGDTPNVV